VHASSSILETDLTLNLLKGTGKATVGVASYPYSSGDYWAWMPGDVDVIDHNPCYDPTTDTPSSGEAVGDRDNGVSIFDGYVKNAVLGLTWPMQRSHGSWVIDKTKTVSPEVSEVSVHAHLTFSGTPRSMHALCVTPSTKQLRPARTVTAAKRILAKAGFPRVKVTAPQFTRAAGKGHFYLSNLIGNRNPLSCGWRGIHLTKSKGWPFGRAI
jgi:hypothetical protein